MRIAPKLAALCLIAALALACARVKIRYAEYALDGMVLKEFVYDSSKNVAVKTAIDPNSGLLTFELVSDAGTVNAANGAAGAALLDAAAGAIGKAAAEAAKGAVKP